MGLFSAETKTYVSSSVYNLAGDVNLRANFLQTTILSSVLSNNKRGIGETLVGALLAGTGIKQRRFFKWATASYDLGMPRANINKSKTVRIAHVKDELISQLGLVADEKLRIMGAVIDTADVDYWARIWLHVNHPAVEEAEWSARWDIINSQIDIQWTVGAVVNNHSIAAPAHFLWGISQANDSRRILYINYRIISAKTPRHTRLLGVPQMFTYRMGTGNVSFDNLHSVPVEKYEFFPVMPLRLNNVPISHASLSTEYDAVKPAFQMLTGSTVDKMLEQIEDNENIDDVDFCFLVQGVSLNAPDKASKRYLYEFLKSLIPDQDWTKAQFNAYTAERRSTSVENSIWDNWIQNNVDGSNLGLTAPKRGQEPPSLLADPSTAPTATELRLFQPDIPDFDQRLSWIYIHESQHQGNGKTYDGVRSRGRLKKGDYWLHVGPDKRTSRANKPITPYDALFTNAYEVPTYNRIYLFYQHSRFAYSKLEVVGMEHKSFVYQGHSVLITAKEALELPANEESAFLVPLHYPTIVSMGLLYGTDLSTASTYLVFNSYTEVTQKWYQTGLFKIIIMIASIAISVLFPPAGGALLGGGILGTNLALGAALGLGTGVAAAIAGAIANAVAAMIVTTLIQKASVVIFGDKLGAILGTLIAFVSMTYASAYASTGSMAVDWGSIMRADNLIKLSSTVTGAYTAWINADTTETYASLTGLAETYAKDSQAVTDKAEDMFGSTSLDIAPMLLSEAARDLNESPESFITRTMLTGAEIAELTQSLVYNFTELSLELPKAYA